MSSISNPGSCPREGCGAYHCRHIGWRRDGEHLFKVFQCNYGHIFFVYWDHEQ